MEAQVSRRRFLQGVAVGTVIVGFDPRTKSWVTEAEASGFPFHKVPALDGVLLSDAASRAAVSNDAGYIKTGSPVAVLEPGSARDISKMLKFCARYGIKAAGRGQGHSTYGQSLVPNGLAISMRSLATVHEIGANSVWTDAGITWKDLLHATVAAGKTPKVLTGYLGLSVGGTLSMGGVSGMSYDSGAQVDHVIELEVVTGNGDIRRCSRTNNRVLFDAVLAGVGEIAIITKARVALMPAKALARHHTLAYYDFAAFFADLRTLLDRSAHDMVWGGIALDPEHGVRFELNAASFYDPGSEPDDAVLLAGLSFAGDTVTNNPYEAFQLRVDFLVDFLRSINLWDGIPHPWLDVFIPDNTIESFTGSLLPTLTLTDIGFTGLIQIFPVRRSKLKQPLLRVPNSGQWVFLFDILTSVDTPATTATTVTELLARNRRLFEEVRDAGGTVYPISAVDMSKHDWKRQLGPTYVLQLLAKWFYDSDAVLNPGTSRL